MLEVTDQVLIEKCLNGDQDSFAELVTRYKKLIYSTVSYYIKDMEEVNDLSQEVFIRIYKALGSYNPQYKFSTWSVKVTRNLCLDFLRKKKVATVSMDEYENFSKDDDTPEGKYLDKEKSLEIRRLINKLPEKYKTLIIMYHQNGASYKEMAEKLDKPMSIIKNRLHRARLTLREDILSAEGLI